MFQKTDNNDYSREAKELYISIATRFGLDIFEEKNPHGEEYVIIPEQQSLDFQIILGLTGGDEAHIGIEEFWCYIFPFPDKIEYLNNTLEGLVRGTHSMTEYRQFNRVTKLCLLDEHGAVIYTDHKKLKIPYFAEKIAKVVSNKTKAD